MSIFEWVGDRIDDIADAIDDAKDFFVDLMEEVWDKIVHFFKKVFYAFKEIVSFFRDPRRLKKLEANKKVIAVSIKENLSSNNYHVVNALYDTETDSLVDYDVSAERIETDSIDSEIERCFGDKAMIVLR